MKHYCREASQLMSDRFDRKLSYYERARLQLHLLICGMCRDYQFNLKLLNTVFAGIRKQVDEEGILLPEKQRRRIEESIRQATNPDR